MHKFTTFTLAVMTLLFTLIMGVSSDKGEITTVLMIGIAMVFLIMLVGICFEDISDKIQELIDELKKKENHESNQHSDTPKIEYGEFHEE